jgi:hypothetical protein
VDQLGPTPLGETLEPGRGCRLLPGLAPAATTRRRARGRHRSARCSRVAAWPRSACPSRRSPAWSAVGGLPCGRAWSHSWRIAAGSGQARRAARAALRAPTNSRSHRRRPPPAQAIPPAATACRHPSTARSARPSAHPSAAALGVPRSPAGPGRVGLSGIGDHPPLLASR